MVEILPVVPMVCSFDAQNFSNTQSFSVLRVSDTTRILALAKRARH